MTRVRLCPACRRLKDCAYRLAGVPACQTCYKKKRYPPARCPLCKKKKPLEHGGDRGLHICANCWMTRYRKRAPCRVCGRSAVLTKGLCPAHYFAQRTAGCPVARCVVTGRSRKQLHADGCAYCTRKAQAECRLRRKLGRLFGERGRVRHPQLRALSDHLLRERYAPSVEAWLRELDPQIRIYFARIRGGASITPEDVEALELLPGGGELRRSLERAHLLRGPTAGTARIEGILHKLVAGLTRKHALVLRHYWRVQVRPSIELRPKRLARLDPCMQGDRMQLRVVADFLASVTAVGILLAELTQDVLDAYVTQRPARYAAHIGRFARWLRTSGRVRRPITLETHTDTEAPGCARDVCLDALDAACTDEGLPLAVRAALILVILARQPLSRCVAIPRSAVRRRGGVVSVRISEQVTWLFEGAAGAVLVALVARHRRWLFESPFGYRGQLSAGSLAAQIHAAGIRVDLPSVRMRAIREFLRDHDVGEAARAMGFSRTWAHDWRRRITEAPRDTKRRLARLRAR